MRSYIIYNEDGTTKRLDKHSTSELNEFIDGKWDHMETMGTATLDDLKEQCKIILLGRSMGLM